jgi:phosphohistidine phosphatase
MAERHLLLFRHAKAERAAPGQRDRDRPLAERGRRDAATMGSVLAKRSLAPDRVLLSPSLRTVSSWEIMRTQADEDCDVRILDALFDNTRGYPPLIRAEGGDAERLLVVGHNPFIQEAAVTLSSDRTSRDAKAIADHVPTAALAILSFDGEWATLAEGSMRLVAFLRPDQSG